MVGRHQASRVVAALPVADHPDEDDSIPMDVFTVATRVTIRRTGHFASSSPMEFLATRVVVAMAARLHFRAH